MNTSKSAIEELGIALSALYAWNSSTDIEALQILLCINLFADERGYAQLVDVRREVGIAHDRMTRCTRLLQGHKKSQSIPLIGSTSDRSPLVDMATYDDSPSVKRIALTPQGRRIVDKTLMPIIERQQRIDELEKQLQEQVNISDAVRALGYDPEKIGHPRDPILDTLYESRARQFMTALIDDIDALSPQQIYALGLPTVQQCLYDLPHFRPDSGPNGSAKVRAQLDLSMTLIRELHSDSDKPSSTNPEHGD
jgi:hypothetical protein